MKSWKIILGAALALAVIAGLYFMTQDSVPTVSSNHQASAGAGKERKVFKMGYMPVITNLAAPLLNHVSKDKGDIYFEALKFSSFAEMGSALRNGNIQAAFIIAPLSVVLRQQGVDAKVVMIGNRHESTLVAKKELNITKFEDLAGKKVAVPMRFSGHNLALLEEMDKRGMKGQLNIVELNPPDMPSAMAAGSMDAYFVGEPFAARSLVNGSATLVHHVEDLWPGFICNLVVVRQESIAQDPELMRQFVRGAARANLWAKSHQEQAAEIAAQYWSQKPDAAKLVFSSRTVVFDKFVPKQEEMQQIANLMVKHGLIEKNNIDGLVDDQFAASVKIEDVRELTDILQ
ncbi:ABC transporter substrate-binding protein [Candidatus Electronema sp. TJ]|uniref:ABC transporter substrate-binding protein n=1 Tax=Candidatus Electronema sp. TJ TaxID=3401573 RepID=UPI003AA86DD2